MSPVSCWPARQPRIGGCSSTRQADWQCHARRSITTPQALVALAGRLAPLADWTEQTIPVPGPVLRAEVDRALSESELSLLPRPATSEELGWSTEQDQELLVGVLRACTPPYRRRSSPRPSGTSTLTSGRVCAPFSLTRPPIPALWSNVYVEASPSRLPQLSRCRSQNLGRAPVRRRHCCRPIENLVLPLLGHVPKRNPHLGCEPGADRGASNDPVTYGSSRSDSAWRAPA